MGNGCSSSSAFVNVVNSNNVALDSDSSDTEHAERYGGGRPLFQSSSSSLMLFNARARYLLGEKIGGGGECSVFLAFSRQNTGLYVAKVASDHNRSLDEEAETLRNLTPHPNVIPFVDYITADNQNCLIVPYVGGGMTVEKLVQLSRCCLCIPDATLKSVVLDVLRGLRHINEQGIIHGDIKGSNVVITSEGKAVIIDFGCSMNLETSANASEKLCQGSAYWMPPEVAGHSVHSHSSDVWSVGALVVEMLTGAPPLSHLDANAAIVKIASLHSAAPILDTLTESDLPCSLTTEFTAFLQACFTIDPAKRPTATELLHGRTGLWAEWLHGAVPSVIPVAGASRRKKRRKKVKKTRTTDIS